MSTLNKVMGGKWIEPSTINPYHVDPPKTEEMEKAESRRAFKLLEMAAKQIAGVR